MNTLRSDSVAESISGATGHQPPGARCQPLADSMFNCEVCGMTSQPREAAHRIVLEIRDVIYPSRPKVNTCWKRVKDGSKFVRTDDSGGVGFESVREVMVCSDCATQLSAKPD